MSGTKGKDRKPGTDQLMEDPQYRLVMELDFHEMIPFVISNIRKKGIFSVLYILVNSALLVLAIVTGIMGLTGSWLTWPKLLLQVVTGLFAGSILIIPPHELLHGAAYRILGARKIRFGADMKQLIFFVTADRYPVSGAELCFLALTPFVLINAATLTLTLLLFPHWILVSMILLLSHNVMCIGDFAILNYARNTAGKVYTFDAPELKKSYFFEEVSGTT